MDRNQTLKSAGFSEDFIKALTEFEEKVPDTYYKIPFDEKEHLFEVADTSGQIQINQPNDNYNSNIIIRYSR